MNFWADQKCDEIKELSSKNRLKSIKHSQIINKYIVTKLIHEYIKYLNY